MRVVLATGAGTQTRRDLHRVRTHHPRRWREIVWTLLATLTSPPLCLRRNLLRDPESPPDWLWTSLSMSQNATARRGRRSS